MEPAIAHLVLLAHKRKKKKNKKSNFASQWGIFFQRPATEIMMGIIDLHQDVCCYLILIAFVVFFLLYRVYTMWDIYSMTTIRFEPTRLYSRKFFLS